MEIRLSPSNKCKFVLPLLGETDILLDHNGRCLNTGDWDEDSLRDFSDNCVGFVFHLFKTNGNRFLAISPKNAGTDDQIQIVFSSKLYDDIPCAFFDELTKQYDNFFVPSDSSGISLAVDVGSFFTVTTDSQCHDEDEFDGEAFNEDEFDNDSPDEDEFDGETFDEDEFDDDLADGDEFGGEAFEKDVFGDETLDDEDDQSETNGAAPQLYDVLAQNRELQAQTEALRDQIAVLHAEMERLKLQTSVGQTANAQPPVPPQDDALQKENDRLKTLISQLIDKEFSEDYIQTADMQINELSQKLKKRKKEIEEKQKSLVKLRDEYSSAESAIGEVNGELNETMDLLHKAESVQKETSADLAVFRKRLNEMLEELNMDIATLEMYETNDSVGALILEANDLKSKLESKLKALISVQQQDSDHRFAGVVS